MMMIIMMMFSTALCGLAGCWRLNGQSSRSRIRNAEIIFGPNIANSQIYSTKRPKPTVPVARLILTDLLQV